MSTPSAADFQALAAAMTTLTGKVGGLLARIAALEQLRPDIAAPPMTPAQPRDSKRKGKKPAPQPQPPQRITAVASSTVPLTFPLTPDLPQGTSSSKRFAMTCVIPDACAGHVIGRQGRGLKQIADISGTRVAAFLVNDHAGPSFGQRHVTIRGTESQIGATLGVVGKCLARQQVRTPRPAKTGTPKGGKSGGRGKEVPARDWRPSSFSLLLNPPAASAAANRPSPPVHHFR
jgi:hypothetical protein